jgi:hypothetical protein
MAMAGETDLQIFRGGAWPNFELRARLGSFAIHAGRHGSMIGGQITSSLVQTPPAQTKRSPQHPP